MRNRLFFSLFVFAGLILVQCESKSKADKTEQKQLPETKRLVRTSSQLTFKIDEATSNTSRYIFPFVDKKSGKNYLSYFNKNKNDVLVFDLDDMVLLKKIHMNEDGPNGVGKIDGFVFNTLDSIYVCPSGKNVIYLVNDSARIIQTLRYRNDDMKEYPFIAPYASTTSSLYRRLEFLRDKIYIVSTLQGNWNSISPSEIGRRRVCFEFDTTAQIGRFLPFTYPKDYWEEKKTEPLFARVRANDTFVYSFLCDHKIYVTTDHLSSKAYDGNSRYFSEFKKQKQNPTIDEYLSTLVEGPRYTNLLYDQYRNAYYRFTTLGEEVKPGDNLQRMSSNPSNVSIIILDSMFNKVGETVFRSNKEFVFDNSFVGRDGLYVSNSHPDNPKADEDQVSFTLFELVDNAKSN